MEKYTNKTITEERNNTGMVRYYVVDREHIPNSYCGGSFLSKKEGIEQLQHAKRLYPDASWTLEAMYVIGNKIRTRKNLGDPLKESVNAAEGLYEFLGGMQVVGTKNINETKNMKNRQVIKLTESDLHRIVKRSVNKVLREGINDITPLSTHIQNNQDADLETLGNIVDDLRKVKEGGALSKWNPTIAARLKKSGLVDTETVQAITQISLLIYRLGNMDFSHKRVYNGETFDDTWNRLQHEQD